MSTNDTGTEPPDTGASLSVPTADTGPTDTGHSGNGSDSGTSSWDTGLAVPVDPLGYWVLDPEGHTGMHIQANGRAEIVVLPRTPTYGTNRGPTTWVVVDDSTFDIDFMFRWRRCASGAPDRIAGWVRDVPIGPTNPVSYFNRTSGF